MNKIQIQTQTIDEQLNVLELATLTIDLWKITRPESNASIDGIENWLKNLVYDEIPVIVKAYKEERLVGWILLFIHDSKRLEINPWALGGHPHVIPEEHDKLEIAQLLLTECINFAKQRDYTRIELFYEPKESKEHYPVDPSLYPQFNLFKEYENIYGGKWAVETNIPKMAGLIIDHINKKREKLGISKEKERVLYDMDMRREIEGSS